MAGAGGARGQGSHGEFWPEVDVFVGVAPSTRLLFLTSLTRAQDIQYQQAEVGAYVDSRLSPHWSVRAGYSFLGSTTNGSSREDRGVVALTYDVELPEAFRLLDRNRVDLRWVNGDFSARYRNRLRFERPVDLGRDRAITPYVQVEPYYYFSKNTIGRITSQIGAEWQMSRRFSLDGGFAHQNDRDAAVDNVNAIALTLTVNF